MGNSKKQAFKNGIVIVGAYATGLQDNYLSAIDRSDLMYGSEIHANIIEQLISNNNKNEMSEGLKVLYTILVGLFTT